MSNNSLVPTICFGDTVRLKSNKIGTVSFIGYTQFKKGKLLYGINLKEPTGVNNGSYNNVRYFKCAQNHGIFVEAKAIVEITKKISVSAAYYHGQKIKITDGIGKGQLLYIGLTKYDGFKNYLYGVKLDNNLNPKTLVKIYKNPHIYYFNDEDNDLAMNEYFDGDALKDAIFVRQNQLRQCSAKKKRSIFGLHFGSKSSKSKKRASLNNLNNHKKDKHSHGNGGHFAVQQNHQNRLQMQLDEDLEESSSSSYTMNNNRLSIDASRENIHSFNGCLTPQLSSDEEEEKVSLSKSSKLMVNGNKYKRTKMIKKRSHDGYGYDHKHKSKISPKKPKLKQSRSVNDKRSHDKNPFEYDYGNSSNSKRSRSRNSNNALHERSDAMMPHSKRNKSKTRKRGHTMQPLKKSKSSGSKSKTKSKSKSKTKSKSKSNAKSPKKENSRKSLKARHPKSKAKSRPSSKSRPVKPKLTNNGHIARSPTDRSSKSKSKIKPMKIQVPDKNKNGNMGRSKSKMRMGRSKSHANIASPVPSHAVKRNKNKNKSKNKKKEKVKALKPAKKIKKRGRSKGPPPNAKSRRTVSSPVMGTPTGMSPSMIMSNYSMNIRTSVNDWSVDDVVAWIQKVNEGRFKQYAMEFKQNEINGGDLKRCTDEHLKRIGVNRYFDRTDMLEAIQNLLIDEYHASMSRWSLQSINCL